MVEMAKVVAPREAVQMAKVAAVAVAEAAAACFLAAVAVAVAVDWSVAKR